MTAAAELSFYGINQYSMYADEYVARMRNFTEKPLVFTEWGGCLYQGNLRQLQRQSDSFVQHTRSEAQPRIAGCSFWAWADYEEHSRAEPASIDGWTVEGLLDAQARPRLELALLSQMCFAMDYPPILFTPQPELLARAAERACPWMPIPLDAVDGDQSSLEQAVAERRSRFAFRNPSFGRQLLAGIPFLCREEHGIAPLLLGAGREEIVIPIARRVRAIAILGHVALKGGYPNNAIWSVYHPDQEHRSPSGSPPRVMSSSLPTAAKSCRCSTASTCCAPTISAAGGKPAPAPRRRRPPSR